MELGLQERLIQIIIQHIVGLKIGIGSKIFKNIKFKSHSIPYSHTFIKHFILFAKIRTKVVNNSYNSQPFSGQSSVYFVFSVFGPLAAYKL